MLPGGEARDVTSAAALAARLGFPVIVKAVGGGGGRGMRTVLEPGELESQVSLAIAEAQAAFADPRVYLERYVTAARHVEVQLLGDGTRVVHLGDRDCSIQRRNQKLVEEAPAPGLRDRLRERMHADAVRFAAALEYRGAGTVEFLVDCEREEYYFIEMNARLQVEHPVTEAVTGIDLVAEQIAIAEGQPLRTALADSSPSGHAIECRINAEDWRDDFRPSPGTIREALYPAGPGLRIDTHVAGRNPRAALVRFAARQAGRPRPRPRRGAARVSPRALERCRSRVLRPTSACTARSSRIPSLRRAASAPPGCLDGSHPPSGATGERAQAGRRVDPRR